MATASESTDSSVQSFQRLKTSLHRQIVDLVDFSKAEQMTESELRAQLRSLAEYMCTRQSLTMTSQQREAMVSEIMDEIYGFGPIESLMVDPTVTDIMINGPDRILIERNGLLESTNLRFADSSHLMQFIHRLVGRAGRRIDESSPIVDARLPDGSRFNAIIPPLALAGPTVSIRRFGNRRIQMEDMIRFGSLAPAMADFLILAVRGRMNIIVSGGTGAGKTTLLRLILGQEKPDAGTVRQGSRIQIAYFDQMREGLNLNASLEDYISPGSEWIEINGNKKHVKSYLSDFLFAPERTNSPVGTLSGGERNRLLLARLFTRPANVLVMDEPTSLPDGATVDVTVVDDAIERVPDDVTGDGRGLRVTSHLVIPPDEITVRATTSGGPGGQHANTANTRVELVFDIASSPSLAPRQRERLIERYGPVLRIVVSDTRSQTRNRNLAIERLLARLAQGLRVEAPRRPTKPTNAAKHARLDTKRQRSGTKQQRRRPSLDD